tara:strand:- start:148 stop:1281 length:1134 start_codon:yes stop_codon:yes gene_type:complete
LKNNFLLDPDITFLNHGSYGACPIPVFEDYQKWQKTLENQPVQFMTDYLWKYLKRSRECLGDFIKCPEEDIILFPNPTTAVNNIIDNLDLSSEDEVLMTQHEYGALVRAWSRASKKNNFKIVQQKIEMPLESKESFVDQFLSGISINTKVIFISHITSQTALIFPVSEICSFAKKAGIITIVDGAHVPGHIDLNLKEIDCDYYTGACHKWLCSPKGTSFLYVRKELQNNIMPQTISWGEEGEDPGPTQFLMDFQWQGTRDMSAFLSIPSAINFVKKNKWRENHIASKEIIIETSQILSELLKTEPLFIGNDWVGQMVSHRLPNDSPETLKNNLWKDFLIEVPIFEWQNQKFIRVSVHYYNDRSDIKRLISALKKLLF